MDGGPGQCQSLSLPTSPISLAAPRGRAPQDGASWSSRHHIPWQRGGLWQHEVVGARRAQIPLPLDRWVN